MFEHDSVAWCSVCVCGCVSVLIGENLWSPGLGLIGEETDH